ncbi:hypothetical protein [Thioalkalivibrio thiocyanodenitrificans]|uniref:hypothetical protein n=1 Tax=Thioalkalivibrio thiocyanodenitrificans TaxID=243063 RepID=UPI00036B4B23|nr:hypothetical protein [Thioalkalivibrio thiocyanodenitrificans]
MTDIKVPEGTKMRTKHGEGTGQQLFKLDGGWHWFPTEQAAIEDYLKLQRPRPVKAGRASEKR